MAVAPPDPNVLPQSPPVAIFIYRRPGLVRPLLACLAPHRPQTIWIIADGPRGPAEAPICDAARRAVEGSITWPCRVERVYADRNLGLKKRLETGLDELFSKEKEAVILEDDCHPSVDFLPFCREMLIRYREQTTVAGISGNCFLSGKALLDTDYFFSRYLHIWGWATWARAWKDYRNFPQPWPKDGFRHLFPPAPGPEAAYWNRIFRRMQKGEIQTWDYPWLAHFWFRDWVSITPAQNLVSNVGLGPDATHTRDASVDLGIRRTSPLRPPYRGPSRIEFDERLDHEVFANHFLRSEGRLRLWPRLFRSFRKRAGFA